MRMADIGTILPGSIIIIMGIRRMIIRAGCVRTVRITVNRRTETAGILMVEILMAEAPARRRAARLRRRRKAIIRQTRR